MSENKLALIDEIKKRIGSADFSDHVERRAYEIALAGMLQQSKYDAAVATLESKGYTWNGGQLWKPPLGTAPDYITDEPATDNTAQQVEALAYTPRDYELQSIVETMKPAKGRTS